MKWKKIVFDSQLKNQFQTFLQKETQNTHLSVRISDVFKFMENGSSMCAWVNEKNEMVSTAVYLNMRAGELAEVWILPWSISEDLLREMLVWIGEQLPSAQIDIEIPLPQGQSDIQSLLKKNGWQFAYSIQAMELQRGNVGAISVLELELDSEMKWQAYKEEFFDRYYETLVAAFGKRPGIVVLPREVQFKRCQQFGAKLQLLTKGTEVLGFVRVELHPNGTGELVSLARDPVQRGKGLGKIIVAKGIETVKNLGAKRVTLEVTLANPVALKLYQEMGFRPTVAMDTWKISSDALKGSLR